MRATRPPLQLSLPLSQLFWERALRTIGIVLHAKIFVDLEQSLLVRDGFQKFFPARIISEKTCRSRFEASIRQLCRQLCVFCPKACARRSRRPGIVREPKWEQHIRQNIGDARLTDERHFLRRCSGCERVMKIPERMIERLKEIIRRANAALARGALKTGPIARQDC